MTETELEQLRERLKNRPRTLYYSHICEETGLNEKWLHRFAARKHGKLNRAMVVTLARYFERTGAMQ